MHALLDAGVDVVVGTTGWTESRYARVHSCGGGGRAVLVPELRDGRGAGHEVLLPWPPLFRSPPESSRCTTRAGGRPRAQRQPPRAASLAHAPEGWPPATPDATEMDPRLGSRGGRVERRPVHADAPARPDCRRKEILLGNEVSSSRLYTELPSTRVSFMSGVLLGVRHVAGPA